MARSVIEPRLSSSGVDIQLFSTFRVAVDGHTVPPDGMWRHRRPAELVQILALTPGHRLQRERIVDALWPQLSPAAGAANLYKAAHRVRRKVGEADAIVVDGGMVSLWPDRPVSTDVERFERAAAAAADQGAATEAAALHGGELLPTALYADWAAPARRRLSQLHLDLLRRGHAWDEVLAADPADEAAHRALMRRHADRGNRTAALRQFQRLRTTLLEQLDLEPSSQTLAVCRELGLAG